MKKIALITGASRGIGAATAELAAAEGYAVCVNYLKDAASAETVAEACRQHGVEAITVQGDVAEPADVERLFETCDRELGPLTLLVNNAGIIGEATRLEALTDEALRRTFEVNVFGAFRCARAAVRRMSTSHGGEGGAIVNLSSIAATIGSANEYIHYAASKAAIDGFTIGLAREVGPEGIRVNSVQAGTADTDIHALTGNPDRPAMVARTAPLRRVATAREIAEAVIWLASKKARYVTGAILRAGGGL